jgi:hypothetical protein
MDITAAFDDQSNTNISNLMGFGAVLSGGVKDDVAVSAQLVAFQAQENATSMFQNPTGELASTIQIDGSDWQMAVFSDSPYARRREYGHLGLSDSLGRVGTDGPIPYFQEALDNVEGRISGIFGDHIQTLIGTLGQ